MIFLGSFYPHDRYEELKKKSKSIDIPGNILQWSILSGLSSNSIEVKAITVPATKRLNGIIFKGREFSNKSISKGYCCGFWDITIIKQFCSSIVVQKKIKNPDYCDKIFFIYSIQSNLLRAVYSYKKHNPNIKVLLMVTDLPQYMNNTNNLVYKLLKTIEIKFINRYLNAIDGYVFLTEQMKFALPIKNKPFIIVEGIFDSNHIHEFNKKDNLKTILYTGSLSRQYGILNLVNAFKLTKNELYRLVICGDGDTKKEIIASSLLDKRILYHGNQEWTDILRLQKESTLLVNPRTPDGEYTKYSFPSKTMEYLGSGTPTLMYKLPGIPNEYYDYCYIIKDIGTLAMAKKIEEILSKPKEELILMGERAKNFILNNKNPKVQCRKIVDLINILK